MRIGLRLQILAAIALLLGAAFVPLWRAIAGVTEQALAAEVSARDREVAELYADAAESGELRLDLARVRQRPGFAACLFDAHGVLRDSVGNVACEVRSGALVLERAHCTLVVWGAGEAATAQARTVTKLTLLYMVLFAVALLAFAFGAITWLVVRPIEALAQAAQRVKRGTEDFVVPVARARELEELAQHLRSMTESLRENQHQLANKVAELTRTTGHLTNARHELAEGERLASVGRLAAGVAHEIGNPLTAIFGLADLLVEGGLSETQVQDFATRIRKESDRANTTIRDLLDFARSGPEPEAGEAARHALAQTVLADVVSTVTDLLGPQRGFRNIAVHTDVDPALRVRMAEPRLTQVLVNLALNAQDAILQSAAVPDEARGTLWFRASREGERCVLRIEDDGPGVDAAVRARLFEPFVTTKEPGRGTGLGLAVCRSLVEAAGGTLRLDAREGSGAQFRLELPLA